MPAVENHQIHRVYLFRFSGVMLALAFSVITINYIIDPYDIYPDIGRHSPASKLDLVNHMRLHKPYALQQHRAEHLVIGSSRAANLPPGVLGDEVYNASLPGIWMRELRLMLEHAHAVSPLETVFIALDYYMFRKENAGKIREDLAAERLLKLTPSLRDRFAQSQQRAKDHWVSLFSIDSLVDSVLSMSSGQVPRAQYLDDGTWLDNPDKNIRWLFSFVNQKRMREFLAESGELDFREFEGVLDFLAANNIDATFFISPFHGSVLSSVRISGRWDNYLAWQKLVSEKVNAYDSSFRVVGIEHNPAIILEAIGSENSFFTDGMHFSPEAGRIIMECVIHGRCPNFVSAHFLNSHNTASYLRDVDSLMKAYPDENPGDFSALQRWLLNVRKSAASPGTLKSNNK